MRNATDQGQGRDEQTDLLEGITLYMPPEADRQAVARLVKAMCALNGMPVAIEVHPEPVYRLGVSR
jgi:hypothetical protein